MEVEAVQNTPRSLRVRLGLTQAQLAGLARVSLRTIRRFERAEWIRSDRLAQLAVSLRVTVQELYDALDTERARRAATSRSGPRGAKRKRTKGAA